MLEFDAWDGILIFMKTNKQKKKQKRFPANCASQNARLHRVSSSWPSLTLYISFHMSRLMCGNIIQSTALALFAVAAEAEGQEIVAIKTGLAKVS